VNIESLQDNHYKHTFECFYHSSPSVTDAYMSSLIGMTQRWPVNRRFYWQYFTDNKFGTLITGCLVRGGRLIHVGGCLL